MTTNHHTAIATGATGKAVTVNTPLGQLDSAVSNLIAGSLGFDQLLFNDGGTLTIASGVITVTNAYHNVDTQAAASTDNLDTINGLATGQFAYLRATNTSRTVVITSGVGNITTVTGESISLDDTERMALVFKRDSSNVIAMQLGGSGAGTSYAILRDEKADTTAGGSASAATWNNRDLNTETYDPDAIVSIASDEFTPVSGDYILLANAPAYQVGGNRLRLYNVTGTASVEEGPNERVDTGSGAQSQAGLKAAFTANGTDAYRIDHYTVSAKATTGLGRVVGDTSSEVYLSILLTRVGE